jgi:LmbE family N-acetylglucosaminyl deacetylase
MGHGVEPTTVIDVSAQLDRKAEMLACHASQREWLRAHHGMDEYIEAMKRFGAERGKLIGAAHAEGFIQHRGHPYPQDDLLKTLFG